MPPRNKSAQGITSSKRTLPAVHEHKISADKDNYTQRIMQFSGNPTNPFAVGFYKCLVCLEDASVLKIASQIGIRTQ